MTHVLTEWQWIGALIARIAVGLLFLLSGGGKVFVRERRASMRETISRAGLPAPIFSATVVSVVEFLFGGFLVAGFLTPVSCILLIAVMFGALTIIVLPGIKTKSFFDWLSQFLYLPEVLYVIILIWLLVNGPGRYSADRLLLSH